MKKETDGKTNLVLTEYALRKMCIKNCPNSEFFLVQISLHLIYSMTKQEQTTNADNKRSKMVKIRHEENEQHEC